MSEPEIEILIREARAAGLTESEIVAAFARGVAEGAPPPPEWWSFPDGGDGYASAIRGLIREAQQAGLSPDDIRAVVDSVLPSAVWTAGEIAALTGAGVLLIGCGIALYLWGWKQ